MLAEFENKVTIALIDSGIHETEKLKMRIEAKVCFLPETTQKREMFRKIEHGTVCAEIIQKIFPEAYFLDLEILQEDGSTSVEILLKALGWCVEHRVKLIHLSLGTINYFDILPLKRQIQRLLENETIIVAAYHNSNIRTYPAMFPRVFGVRQDREGILKENQFIFQKQERIPPENAIIAHWWGPDGKNRVNSYAAPVITGYIARYLQKNPQAKFEAVKNYLMSHAVQEKIYCSNIKDVFQRNEKIEALVICGAGLAYGKIKILKNFFEAAGYYCLVLQDVFDEKEAIPMKYYEGNGNLLKYILYTIDKIYRADIIFLDLSEIKVQYIEEKELIDVCIFSTNGVYQVFMDEILEKVKTIEDIYRMVCCHFNEEQYHNKKELLEKG